MSTEILWSVVGISISVIFGVVGIYLTIKSRYPGKITFINEQTIELFDAIGNSLDKLEVSYNRESVTENLVLLNGAFVNTGKTDISTSMVEQPITISLPEGYKWLTGKVVFSKSKAALNHIDEQNISIETGLFRCGEYVRFHALAQLPDNEDGFSNAKKLKKSLKFKHRITNTTKVETAEAKPRIESKKEYRRRALPMLVMLIITVAVFSYSLYIGTPKSLAYPYQVASDKVELVRIKTTREDIVEIVSNESDFEIDSTIDDFIKNKRGNPSLIESNKHWDLYFAFGMNFLIVLLMIGMSSFDYFKNNK